jgi:hypothetical protein
MATEVIYYFGVMSGGAFYDNDGSPWSVTVSSKVKKSNIGTTGTTMRTA